jgi:hypothetical protein
MSAIDMLQLSLALVAIALALFTIWLAASQTKQARHIAVSIYATFDRITRRVAETPILVHEQDFPVAATSVTPRVIRHNGRVSLTLTWNDVFPGQRFQPDEDDTVVCKVLTPDDITHHTEFAGSQSERVEYLFPDHFGCPRALEPGPYEVRWEPGSQPDPDNPILYGFDTFFVQPS